MPTVEMNAQYNQNQIARVAEILVVGPLLIYVSRNKAISPMLRHTLLGVGILTMVYNGYNYIKNWNTDGKIAATLNNIEDKVESQFDNNK